MADPPPQVLVVEDDSPIRTMLTDLLEDAGYSVTAANDGLQALEYLRHLRPHLIVLDLMMPGLSGWQLLERSRVQLSQDNIPVIVLSAIRGENDYPATMGVAAWFTKPLDVPRFLRAVDELAGRASAREASSDARPRTGPAHILVIEDDAPISKVVSEHLEQEGYSPAAAASIGEAEARLREQQPALIVLDLMLPGQDGWTFLRARRHRPALAAIPVIVISAAPRDGLLNAKELGADAFLTKPFDLDVMTALVRGFID